MWLSIISNYGRKLLWTQWLWTNSWPWFRWIPGQWVPAVVGGDGHTRKIENKYFLICRKSVLKLSKSIYISKIVIILMPLACDFDKKKLIFYILLCIDVLLLHMMALSTASHQMRALSDYGIILGNSWKLTFFILKSNKKDSVFYFSIDLFHASTSRLFVMEVKLQRVPGCCFFHATDLNGTQWTGRLLVCFISHFLTIQANFFLIIWFVCKQEWSFWRNGGMTEK